MNPPLNSDSEIFPLPAEQLLIDSLQPLISKWKSNSALVISPGRSQLASCLGGQHGLKTVVAWYLDLYSATQARENLPDLVQVQCSSELPEGEFDLVGMPILKKSEAELTRELMQQAHLRLVTGGVLAVSVDNPRDQWVHQQMQALFDKVSCDRTKSGCFYFGRKSGPLTKEKDFSCQFAFRDEEGRLLQGFTRPGVFSHRRVDAGARQLMKSAEIGETDNVLDMGCGAGTVAMASALQTTGTVFAVDSNARAIECTQRGAELNGIENLVPTLNADGDLKLPVDIDLVLANPPYYGNDGISKHFVDTAVQVLRPAGALIVVTKKPRWYAEYFDGLLEDVTIFESSKYFLACGRKT